MLHFMRAICVFLATVVATNGLCDQPQGMKKVCIFAPWWGPMFEVDHPVYNRDDCMTVYYQLRQEAWKRGYHLEQISSVGPDLECDLLMVFDLFPEQLSYIETIPKEKRVLFLWEPPSTIPNNENFEYHKLFSKIYTWNDDLVDSKTYFKLYYPVLKQMLQPQAFCCKKLCAMITANKWSAHPQELYSMRREVIEFFEEKGDGFFDLYGYSWPHNLSTYRGTVVKKSDVLQHYKFAFAYENMCGIAGYVTEKIFDVFHAGCVPIYCGASNMDRYVPRNCYIAREDFASNEELFEHLKAMPESDYETYLNNIQKFLQSEDVKRFSSEQFIQFFLEQMVSVQVNF